MSDMFSRTEALIGSEALAKLKESKVCIFGIGGVGSYALEALVRAGVGNIIIVDNAEVDESNLNRQLIALSSTIGEEKTEAAVRRCLDINPGITILAHQMFADEENIPALIPEDTDYIVDAIDSVTSKLALIEYAVKSGIPIVSSAGTGNKLHPERLQISDIYKTAGDPLARVMRSELRKRGVKKLKVVWSDEKPVIGGDRMPVNKDGRKVPASISYVPPVAGMLLASVVVNELTGK